MEISHRALEAVVNAHLIVAVVVEAADLEAEIRLRRAGTVIAGGVDD